MEVTREEFYRAIDSLKSDLRDDIGGIQDRLDTLNGRTGKSELAIGKLEQRVDGAERTISRRRLDDEEDAVVAEGRHRRNARDGTAAVLAEDGGAYVSTREKALIGFGLAVVMVLLKVLELVGTKLWDVMTHKP